MGLHCLVPRRRCESEKKKGARGLMGRERIAKRLADLAFKMAADNSCSSESVLDHQERPVHVAFFDKKLPCPQTFYKDKKYFFFFYKDGINHHFRTVHRKAITNEELREAQV